MGHPGGAWTSAHVCSVCCHSLFTIDSQFPESDPSPLGARALHPSSPEKLPVLTVSFPSFSLNCALDLMRLLQPEGLWHHSVLSLTRGL